MTTPPTLHGPFAIAYFLAVISLIILLLIIPPICWRLRNSNLAATILIAWLLILLLLNAINALTWPSDDFTTWFQGAALCDFEIKMQVAAQVALPSCFARILKALAGVLDSRRVSLVPSQRQKRRGIVGDVIWCILFPLGQMVGQWVVQPTRYLVYGITGCVAPRPANWLYVLLIVVPPAVWVAVGTYFAVLVVVRLYRYRASFSDIILANGSSKSRFLRLYMLCLTWIFFAIPFQGYIIALNAHYRLGDYSWTRVHDTDVKRPVEFVRSDGRPLLNCWIPIVFGLLIFIFFGFGKEAVAMYRSGLIAMGFGKFLPCLHQGSGEQSSASSSCSKVPLVARVRALFKRDDIDTTLTSMSFTERAAARRRTVRFDLPDDPHRESIPNTYIPAERAAPQVQLYGEQIMIDMQPTRPLSERIRSFLRFERSRLATDSTCFDMASIAERSEFDPHYSVGDEHFRGDLTELPAGHSVKIIRIANDTGRPCEHAQGSRSTCCPCQ